MQSGLSMRKKVLVQKLHFYCNGSQMLHFSLSAARVITRVLRTALGHQPKGKVRHDAMSWEQRFSLSLSLSFMSSR